MKTLFVALGALALAATSASAEGDGDGGKAQKEFYAVVRGDYRLPQADQLQTGRAAAEADLRTGFAAEADTAQEPVAGTDNR